jgi:hypothetical protein
MDFLTFSLQAELRCGHSCPEQKVISSEKMTINYQSENPAKGIHGIGVVEKKHYFYGAVTNQ